MFTDNYIKLQKILFCEDSISMVNCTGEKKSIYNYYAPHYYGNIGYSMRYARCQELPGSFATSKNPITATGSPFGVYFGSGTTPASKEDYTLESIITSGLNITNSSAPAVVNPASGKYVVSADFIVRNTSAEDITICEIGIFTPVSTMNSNYEALVSTTYGTFLMERTVLDEPITIPAGEAKMITYAIEFNQTTGVD